MPARLLILGSGHNAGLMALPLPPNSGHADRGKLQRLSVVKDSAKSLTWTV